MSDEKNTDVGKALRSIQDGVQSLQAGQTVIVRVERMEAAILTEVRAVKADIDKMNRTLHGEGDGNTGLVARVVALENASAERAALMAREAAERVEEKRGRTALAASVIAAIAAVACAIVTGLLAWRTAPPTPPIDQIHVNP